MTRVDFYLGNDGAVRSTLACRLAETAYRRGHQVFLWVPQDEIEAWDTLLWTFSDTSFVPHGSGSPNNGPVVIGAQLAPAGDVLIPLVAQAPPAGLNFARILEPVGADETEKEQSRTRFRYYREQGLKPVVHNLP